MINTSAQGVSATKESGVSAIELFTSDDYIELVTTVKNWKEMGLPANIKLSDFIRQYQATHRDKIAGILVEVWPFLYQVIETAKENQRKNEALQQSISNDHIQDDEQLAKSLQAEEDQAVLEAQ